MKTFKQIEKEVFKRRPPLFNKFEQKLPPKLSKEQEAKKIKEFENKLKLYELSLSKIKINQLEQKAKLLAKQEDWKLFEYEGYNYFLKKTPFSSFLIKDNIKINKKTEYIIVLTILFNILFILFYVFLIKKLKPLIELKNSIHRFSKGDLNINTASTKKDEISAVSNEFNNAIIQIRTLTQSRNLFLRNIMHELKTPITKGLLILSMMKNNESKESLEKLFFRLEYLINEFAKIEKFTSNNITIKKSQYRVIDILDQALDILFIENEDINLYVKSNTKITVDFEMFAIVLKNLIDNAIKYSNHKALIVISKECILISNKGKELEKPLEEYGKPFNRKYESSQKGLGLGLYIVKNILDLHDLKLQYNYKKNRNIFIIKY